MTLAQLRAKALGLRNEAQAIYLKYKDDPDGMPDAEAVRYDGVMDQFDAAHRDAEAFAAREQRMNAAAALQVDQRVNGGGYATGGAGLPHNDPTNTRNGKHQYSLVKAIRQCHDRRHGRGNIDGLEAEVHQALSARRFLDTGKTAEGIMVPFDLTIDSAEGACRSYAGDIREQRALDTTAGAGSIPTILSTDLISILRARMVTAGMGATVLADMQGLFAIPRQNQAATGYWVGEAGAPTASNQAVDQVPFSPKTVGAFTDYTRRFLEQTSISVEQFVRADLMAVLARSVELAALNGLGSSNQPTGIGQNSSVPTVALGTNGAIPTWAWAVAMESALAIANADLGSLGYVVNAATRGIMKVTPKIGSTFPIFLWDSASPNTPINGYQAGVTNLLPKNLTKGSSTTICSMGLFGNWNDLVIALWSGIDLLTDPYTGSSSGNVRVVALQDCDISVRHPESFVKCVDILTA